MPKRLFTDHPASVGESYAEHFRVASGVGLAMIAGGLACLAHALCPALFQTTASRTIARLAKRIAGARAARGAADAEARSGWVI